ncbi:hypothetical protein BGW38_006492, partial [Lunasporangiospora selenospora]
MNPFYAKRTRKHGKNAFLEIELGISRPAVLRSKILANRVLSMSLEPTINIQREHVAAVNTLDIEEAEGR